MDRRIGTVSVIITRDAIGAMTGKLGALKGIQVKSALTKA